MLCRSPGLLLRPRFLAEEGAVYYQYIQHSSLLDGLSFVSRSNYQLLTNLICLVAVHVPERYAAFPTTYIAALLDIYGCFLLAETLSWRGASPATVMMALLLFALQPAGYEVLLNTTNVMWVCSASTLFICLSREHAPRSARAWLAYASVALFGLTGVPSLTLLPFYALQAAVRRSAYRVTLLALLTGAAAVQASIVLSHGPDPDRAMTFSAHSVVPIVFQTELADVVPSEALDTLGGRIVDYDADGIVIALQVTLLGLGLLIGFHGLAWRAMSRVDRFIVPGAMILVSAANEFGALGQPEVLHSGWGGSRYFFLGNTCFLLLICLARDGGSALQRRLVTGAMVLIISNGVVQSYGAGWVRVYTVGPSVSGQVKACGDVRPCRIEYPPHGPGAEFMMDRTPIPDYRLP